MTEHKFTRCPGCTTVFRITAEQLALREGQVRCGHCRAVFDANDHLVSVHEPVATGGAPVEEAPVEEAPVEEAPVEQAPVEEAPVEQAPVEQAPAEQAPAEQAPVEVREPQLESTTNDAVAAPTDRQERFEWKPRKSLRETPKALQAVAIGVLLLALVAQAILEYRDSLAAHAPFTRPILQAACRPLGCAVGPLRDAQALSIDASDLQADPAHRGLLQLSATIRNRATYAIAYPYLELTLTDASDQVVVRRAFAPGDYIGGTANASAGIPANGEKLVRLFIDASATAQAGYRLYLFYP